MPRQNRAGGKQADPAILVAHPLDQLQVRGRRILRVHDRDHFRRLLVGFAGENLEGQVRGDFRLGAEQAVAAGGVVVTRAIERNVTQAHQPAAAIAEVGPLVGREFDDEAIALGAKPAEGRFFARIAIRRPKHLLQHAQHFEEAPPFVQHRQRTGPGNQMTGVELHAESLKVRDDGLERGRVGAVRAEQRAGAWHLAQRRRRRQERLAQQADHLAVQDR